VPFHRDITKQSVAMAHDLGMGVNVWTVNSESDMIKMINYGVDGIITDFPNRLKKVCETNNVKWF
jgi:glycerophosphoryl diester phosphodiesterase